MRRISIYPALILKAQSAGVELVSRGLASYSNTGTASLANNADYTDLWTPSGGPTNYIDIEVGSIVGSMVADGGGYKAAIIAWSTDDFDYYQPSGTAVPDSYTIDTNTAALGSYPAAGWVNAVTVTGNTLRTKAHIINLAGINHVRVNVTAMVGAGATACKLNVDIFDVSRVINGAHTRVSAGIAHIGDSVTARSMVWGSAQGADASLNAKQSFTDRVFAATGRRTFEFGLGWSGSTSAGWDAQLPSWIGNIPTKYCEVSLGINDAGTGVSPSAYNASMTSIVNQLATAGIMAIIPSIIKCTGSPYAANIPALNTEITNIISANPTKCIAGADYYNNAAITISGDGIHPDSPGIVARANAAADWFISAGLT
jgi:hypothetical protein